MALTVSGLHYNVEGAKKCNDGIVTGDTSYPTGGWSLAPEKVGLDTVERFGVDFLVNSTPAVRAARYDYTNEKLMAFGENFAEIANGTDLSAFSARFEAKGY